MTNETTAVEPTPTIQPVEPSEAAVEVTTDETAGAEAGSEPGELASVPDVIEAMRDVIDPEIGVNIVDLGLVYGAHVDDGNVATLDVTLTSAACPLTDVIEDQTRLALRDLVADVRINWVWMPPWSMEKITDDGREQMRALGFNI